MALIKKPSEQVSYNMSRIKSKNTLPERLLRKALYKKGLRYRLNSSLVPGHPDILFKKYKIAVFVDGDFWHGRDYKINEVKTNTKYWNKKIKANIERDIKINQSLAQLGYTVIRLWEKEIEKDTQRCSDIVFDAVQKKENPYSES